MSEPRQENKQSRSRGWVFTINNPTDEDWDCIKKLSDDARYVVAGREVGENGTPHIQGYCFFKETVRFSRVKKHIKRAFLEKQRGNNIQAIDYCKKDNNFEEWGTPPENNNQKEKWRSIIDLAENGNLSAIKEEHPRIYLQFYEKLKSLNQVKPTIIQGELEHEWWYGPTGTGKSMKLWSDYPEHYAKQINKWWDGYKDQEVVAIEEWSPKNECTASQLKIWADRYPFPAQIKNGTLPSIRPLKIIVTSNYTIRECFPCPQDHEPLLRRFKIIHFPQMFIPRPANVHCAPEESSSSKESDPLLDDSFINHLIDNLESVP